MLASRLSFNHQGGFGNVMPLDDGRVDDEDAPPHVHGAVLLLRAEQMQRLVGFEGGYATQQVDVHTYDGVTVRAVTFVTKPSFRIREALPTTDVYKNKLCVGARHLRLQADYVVCVV